MDADAAGFREPTFSSQKYELLYEDVRRKAFSVIARREAGGGGGWADLVHLLPRMHGTTAADTAVYIRIWSRSRLNSVFQTLTKTHRGFRR